MKEPRTFTREDVDALRQWFDGRTLPESISIGQGYHIPNLSFTLERIFSNIEQALTNPNKTGDFYLLERIKAFLEQSEG